MAKIYLNLILKGAKTYADVPDTLKDEVKELLIAQDRADLITEGEEA